MSNPFEVIKWARGQDLPQAQKLILLILTTYADKSNACHPGGRVTGPSRRGHVIRDIARPDFNLRRPCRNRDHAGVPA